MKKISVHDNSLLSYEVLCKKHEIHLHTAYYDAEPHEYTDVIFSGVIAYHLVYDNLHTIIFDIEEVDIEKIYADNEDLFIHGKNHGWPISHKSKEELLLKMKDENIKGFVINSSYGVDGWVWAQNVIKTQKSVSADKT
jgi:hypothetical protein